MTEHMTYPADIAESAMYLRACADELRAKELDISAAAAERCAGDMGDCRLYRNWCLSVASKTETQAETFRSADSYFAWASGSTPVEFAELLAGGAA